MKLTRKQRSAIESAMLNMKAARDYIFSDQTAVCCVSKFASTVLHFTRNTDNRVLFEVERSYGSNLCRLDMAIKQLENLLYAQEVAV